MRQKYFAQTYTTSFSQQNKSNFHYKKKTKTRYSSFLSAYHFEPKSSTSDADKTEEYSISTFVPKKTIQSPTIEEESIQSYGEMQQIRKPKRSLSVPLFILLWRITRLEQSDDEISTPFNGTGATLRDRIFGKILNIGNNKSSALSDGWFELNLPSQLIKHSGMKCKLWTVSKIMPPFSANSWNSCLNLIVLMKKSTSLRADLWTLSKFEAQS